MENNTFKLTNQDEQLVFDILSTETDKFGYTINHIKTSDNRLFDMVENNGVKYFKPTGEDWKFGSILSIGVTLLTLYGKEIIEWASALFESAKSKRNLKRKRSIRPQKGISRS